jgi:hypothetical protein
VVIPGAVHDARTVIGPPPVTVAPAIESVSFQVYEPATV